MHESMCRVSRNRLQRALLGALVGGCSLSAVAGVSVNPRGLGQVLLYPYFTVNSGNDTYLTVTNTTNRGKAVKVRFREARNGKDVLSLNLYLSPYDVWTAAVFSLDANGPANLLTRDTTCTVPALRGNASLQQLPDGTRYTPFRNFEYSGSNNDQGGTRLSRAREGFLEVIEMGELVGGIAPTQVLEEITHVPVPGTPNTGMPLNCALPIANWFGLAGAWAENSGNRQRDITAPSGGLYGAAQIINVGNGTLHAYAATAIDGFYGGSAPAGGLHTAPGDARPDLTSASDGSGMVASLASLGDGTTITSHWTAGTADAVSAVLMQDKVINDFDTESAIGAATEWLQVFPTKAYYTDSFSVASLPFSDPFRDDGKSCEPVKFQFYDREEQPMPGPDVCVVDFLCGPPPIRPTAEAESLCYVAQVVSFNQAITPIDSQTGSRTAIFGSDGALDVVPRALSEGPPADRGWLELRMLNPLASNPVGARTLRSIEGDTYFGLPLIGVAAMNFVNSNAQPGRVANYSGAVPHRSIVRVTRGR